MANPILISGRPVPYSRPRFVGNRVYDPRAINKKNVSKILLASRDKFFKGPLEVLLVFSFKPAASLSKKKKAHLLERPFSHIKKPDLDNLIKFILDCASGILFEDDKQIISCNAMKKYGEEDCTGLSIKEISEYSLV